MLSQVLKYQVKLNNQIRSDDLDRRLIDYLKQSEQLTVNIKSFHLRYRYHLRNGNNLQIIQTNLILQVISSNSLCIDREQKQLTINTIQLQFQRESLNLRMNKEQIRRTKLRESYHKKYLQSSDHNLLGNYKMLMNDYHKGSAFLTLGPNYLFFIVSFLIANLATIYLLLKLNKLEDGNSFFFVLVIVILYFDIVWLGAALINPGIATANENQQGEVCEICEANNGIEVVKKANRIHCEECGICIDDHQMHLRLIGGCVGKNNFIAFKLLLLGVFLWGISMITIVPITYNMMM